VTGKAPASGGIAQEGPSFKDLLAGAEAEAAPVEGDGTADQQPALADDGGEDTPPDGNPLPLATPLLPPAERVMIATLPVTEEGAALSSGFLDPAEPGRFMERMRRMFARIGLERQEVKLLRGLLAALERKR
jgi:hypothetical protein